MCYSIQPRIYIYNVFNCMCYSIQPGMAVIVYILCSFPPILKLQQAIDRAQAQVETMQRKWIRLWALVSTSC